MKSVNKQVDFFMEIDHIVSCKVWNYVDYEISEKIFEIINHRMVKSNLRDLIDDELS